MRGLVDSPGAVKMGDEYWTHRVLPTDRVPSPPRVSKGRSSLRWWSLSEKSVLLGSVSRDGVRSVDLPRESSRHRSLPAFGQWQTLPQGVPRQGGTLDVGRCERITRLAHLRRLCAGLDRPRSPALCERSPRYRFGPELVCVGLHDHRPVPVLVSMGEIPKVQSSGQDAHLVRPAWQYPHVYPHYRRQSARREDS